MVFGALRATHAVVDGYEPPPGASATEQAAYDHIEAESLPPLLQAVSEPILRNQSIRFAHISSKDTPRSLANRPGHEPARHFPRRARAFTIYFEARAGWARAQAYLQMSYLPSTYVL